MSGSADDETWTAALQPYTAAQHSAGGAGYHASGDNTQGRVPGERTWRHELPRWLASLNPGRTAREYEKAIGYFFETPGVPHELTLITFDLLLAYRGALALRAAPQERGSAYRPPTGRQRREETNSRLGSPHSRQALPRDGGGDDGGDDVGSDDEHRNLRSLAPATVNLRLTALRQFLVHCALLGVLPELSPDHIRAALRRLPVEHRRPYQILDEAEWDGFLQAALLPAVRMSGEPPETLPAASAKASRPPGPWGTPHAVRLSRDGIEPSQESYGPDKGVAADAQPTAVVKSHFGLTGTHTAQRDHALIALALATGLRAIELAQLDIGDLQRERHAGHEEWWLVLPDAKTKGQKGGRTLPLAPSLVQTLMDYIRASDRKWEDPHDQNKPLFVAAYKRHGRHVGDVADRTSQRATSSTGRLLAGQIARIVDRVESQWLALRAEESARADNKLQAGETRSISTHALRHSTAVALLAGNQTTGRPPASVEHVRGWLGHFDIRTTQGYLAHLDARRHRRPFALAPGTDASGKASSPEATAPEATAPVADDSASSAQSDDDRQQGTHER
jgi:integrase